MIATQEREHDHAAIIVGLRCDVAYPQLTARATWFPAWLLIFADRAGFTGIFRMPTTKKGTE